jgi:hypothetical protein
LRYNGVTFSSLYHSKVDGKVVVDAAQRTTRYMQWELQADGVVTLEAGLPNTDQTWAFIRQKLSADGALLTYVGQGFGGLQVGPGAVQDLAWGPIPEVLNFQPLGQGRAAFISWRCTVRIAEFKMRGGFTPGVQGPVVQFNYESALSYDEEGYASITIKGTLEVPLSRGPANQRAIALTVDNFRQKWLDISFDLTRYKVTRREFPMTRDKRTSEWQYTATELAPAGLPLGHTGAHGTMSLRPLRSGGGPQGKLLAVPMYVCSMKCSYALRSDFPRRVAFLAFCSLLWYRMWSALNGDFPTSDDPNSQQNQKLRQDIKQFFKDAAAKLPVPALPPPPIGGNGALAFYKDLAANQTKTAQAVLPALTGKGGPLATLLTTVSRLMDFGFDEGLYEDSKTITFQAAWTFTCTFSTLMAASGVWNYAQDVGGQTWATSVGDIVGWRGPLAARIDPSAEVIVDMGGGAPLSSSPLIEE